MRTTFIKQNGYKDCGHICKFAMDKYLSNSIGPHNAHNLHLCFMLYTALPMDSHELQFDKQKLTF